MFSLSSLALKLTTITASVSESILLSIALVIVVAALIAFIARMFKQEIVIAYIVAGILIGPLCLGLIKDTTLIKQLAEIGVAFLLFVAGLEMNAKKLKDSFASSLITAAHRAISPNNCRPTSSGDCIGKDKTFVALSFSRYCLQRSLHFLWRPSFFICLQ